MPVVAWMISLCLLMRLQNPNLQLNLRRQLHNTLSIPPGFILIERFISLFVARLQSIAD